MLSTIWKLIMIKLCITIYTIFYQLKWWLKLTIKTTETISQQCVVIKLIIALSNTNSTIKHKTLRATLLSCRRNVTNSSVVSKSNDNISRVAGTKFNVMPDRWSAANSWWLHCNALGGLSTMNVKLSFHKSFQYPILSHSRRSERLYSSREPRRSCNRQSTLQTQNETLVHT